MWAAFQYLAPIMAYAALALCIGTWISLCCSSHCHRHGAVDCEAMDNSDDGIDTVVIMRQNKCETVCNNSGSKAKKYKHQKKTICL